MRGGCLLAVGARRARGSNKFSSVQFPQKNPDARGRSADEVKKVRPADELRRSREVSRRVLVWSFRDD